MSDVLLEANHVKKYFKTPKGILHAVDDVTFSIDRGKTLGVVGESGCGKSTTGRVVLRLLEPTEGSILMEGEDISKLSEAQMRNKRKEMQMIFQDPLASLDPRKTVGQIIEEPLKIHNIISSSKERQKRVLELMETVGLAQRYYSTYPHELDGGRRQRIGIARALSMKPKFIVCDEPVSALDVSIQAQILNLLEDLQKQMGLTYMFITHDLGIVAEICDTVAIVYAGHIVEYGTLEDIFNHTAHPYTVGLFGSLPNMDDRTQRLKPIPGLMPDPTKLPAGCPFCPRCPHATEKCKTIPPEFVNVGGDHIVACHLLKED